jgi:hypothetical protein
MRTVLLLLASNLFMTFAWYGHLRFKHLPLATVIVASWLIALPEYALQVPANRWGHGQFTAPQLKLLQEVISLSIFSLFAVGWLREPLRWNDVAAFTLVLAAVWVSLYR